MSKYLLLVLGASALMALSACGGGSSNVSAADNSAAPANYTLPDVINAVPVQKQ